MIRLIASLVDLKAARADLECIATPVRDKTRNSRDRSSFAATVRDTKSAARPHQMPQWQQLPNPCRQNTRRRWLQDHSVAVRTTAHPVIWLKLDAALFV